VAACAEDAVGGLLALPVPDTLKRSAAATGDVERVDATVSRVSMWAAQTPQMFRLGLLREALAHALASGAAITDEASAVEATGLRPRLVRGDYDNLKVTWPEDLALAQRLLRGRQEPASVPPDVSIADTSAVHRNEVP
jgi:2-C-methyl-D-erythritol 4-phosphate cytidylyltransferase